MTDDNAVSSGTSAAATPPSAGPASSTGQAVAAPAHDGQDRRGGQRKDRRGSVDRRLELDRRRGPGRRRSDDRRSAEEGEMTEEQFTFLMAIQEYKRINNRPFPSWTEVLDVLHALGYRKVAEPGSVR
jgi:hypothetical protein